MSSPTFANLSPLVADQKVERGTLHVTFRCPQSGTEVAAKARITADDGIAATAGRQARKGLFAGLKRQASQAIRGVAGNGVIGKIARTAADTAIKQQAAQHAHSADELAAAVVAAFATVAQRFRWDAAAQTWVATDAATTG